MRKWEEAVDCFFWDICLYNFVTLSYNIFVGQEKIFLTRLACDVVFFLTAMNCCN